MWSPAGPSKSLDTRGVLLFIVASLSWLPVLGNRRILVVIGGGLVSFVVAGGARKSLDTRGVPLFVGEARKQRGGEAESIYQG